MASTNSGFLTLDKLSNNYKRGWRAYSMSMVPQSLTPPPLLTEAGTLALTSEPEAEARLY